jgi:peptidyl-prolyl cis-trans isomerase SurA
MKPGDVSDVLQTPSGFHIVKLMDTRAVGGPQIVQQVHLRHILLKPTEIEDDATVEQKLSRWREQVVSGKEEFAVIAKTYSQDSASAVNGGDLGWSEGQRVRAGIRRGGRRPEGRRDQPAIPHPVRLAHRADARASRFRQHQ